jgi:[ribosomal protein S5]-alanine N-acetyltransferase
MKVIETERLILRRLSTGDAAFILALLNQPSFLRFIGDRGVRSIDDARKYIRRGPLESYARLGFGLYRVELKDGRLPIGICGLIKRETLEAVDLGYAFLPQFWSKGYACEAAAAVVAYAREVLKLKRVLAIVAPDNERSIRVLEKVGMKFERLMIWPGDSKELKLYALEI